MMISNRIKELREARGWTMEQLAEKIGAKSASTVNRLEKGETELVSDWLPKLAQAFGVRWTEIIVIHLGDIKDGDVMYALGAPMGLVEEATPFEPPPTHPLAGVNLGKNRDLWEVHSEALDAIGIYPGDLVIVDISKTEVDKVAMGDAVVVQFYSDEGADTFMRQFIEPDLFITNSLKDNPSPFNRRTEDVHIKGKILKRIAGFGPRRH